MICLLVCVCTVCMQCLQRPDENGGSSETVVTDDCELPCGFWKSNLGLDEKWVAPPETQLLVSNERTAGAINDL